MNSTDDIDPSILEELVEIVNETLDALVETSVTTGPLPPVAGHDGLVIEATVPIVGDVSAELTLRVPAATAVALTAVMMDTAPHTLTTNDGCDTMSELINLFGGSAKFLIDDETALDIPRSRIISAPDLEELAHSTLLTHDLGVFELQLRMLP
ncbi:MAG: hypothetical protein ACC652_09510 [Acidimicrobiales bacterium]